MPPEVTALDPAALQRLRDLDPTGSNRLLERVFKAFEDSAARMREHLLAARAAGYASGMRNLAHTLKSSSASIGAVKLSQLCAEMEAIAKLGRTEGLDQLTTDLCAQIDAVLLVLRQPMFDRSQ